MERYYLSVTDKNRTLETTIEFDIAELGAVVQRYTQQYLLVEVEVTPGIIHLYCKNRKEGYSGNLIGALQA